MKFDVFGRKILVTRTDDHWDVFYLGAEGKRRVATDIVIPAGVAESEVELYLGDLCHEWATERHPVVARLD